MYACLTLGDNETYVNIKRESMYGNSNLKWASAEIVKVVIFMSPGILDQKKKNKRLAYGELVRNSTFDTDFRGTYNEITKEYGLKVEHIIHFSLFL